MNREQLRQILQAEGIRSDAYDLDGGHESERYTLGGHATNWHVYYSERGLESGKRRFLTESAACEYLLELLRNDPLAKA